MRTRDAKLTDYNVPKEDEERLDEYCKKRIRIYDSFFWGVQYQ